MKQGVDYIGVGIGAVIVNSEGKILLGKRGKKARNESGKWEFPGGGIEFGDTMRDSIIREIQEELGITIELFDHLPPIDQILPEENQHWVTSVFLARIVEGELRIMEPEKCDEIGWFDINEIEGMRNTLSNPTAQYLPRLKKLDLQSF